MNLNKDDVERITENVLRRLRLDMENGHWTDPNRRTVALYLDDMVLSRVSFDVSQRPEYEG